MKASTLLLAGALVLGACAGTTNHVAIANDVAISITPATDDLPFDPRGARLRSATEQLSRLAGHPIAFQFDAAVVSAVRPDFERQLIDAIEQVARSLTAWKEAEPSAFPRTANALRKIECRYRATAKEPSATFDANSGVMAIDLDAHPAALVPRGAFYEAIATEDDAYRETVFGRGDVDSIPASDRRAYFEYLTRTRPGWGSLYERRFRDRPKGLAPADALAQSPHADVIARVVRLHDLSKRSDPELATKARAWLFDQLYSFFHNAYRQKELVAIGPGTPFRNAEAAYGRFLAAEVPSATDKERLATARYVCDTDAPQAYPTFDRFAFGLGIVDAWFKAGMPQTARADDPKSQLFDEVVCPSVRTASGEHTRDRSCSSMHTGWLGFATSSADGQKKLAQALDARNDAALADQVLYTVHYSSSTRRGESNAFLEVFHALDPKLRSWRAAVDILASERHGQDEAEAARIWKAYPDKRGSALLLVARAHRDYGRYNGDEYWKRFPESYGTTVDATVLGGMLDHGRIALELVPQLWPALSRGYSRADLLVPRLDTLVPDASSADATDALRSLSDVVTRLCEDKNTADLDKLHAYFERRATARPAEQRAFAILRRDTAPGGCKARTKKPAEESP
ncbi:hypothetical protein AKJ09_03702 [Labilithrix luteola]|uniref:Uncharacterized protein n=1 Tax=Labilithrix luteola TaxID=1391654 RepID=A0A0K1PU20_9BACT|nr:hypothetical protein [Labilithrix luteola]AKU97038.1 hypothetical protein AKJ09_03702 [Labilithrix luteola]